MYHMSFCNYPNFNSIYRTDTEYEDDIVKNFELNGKIIDQFIYLIDMPHILEYELNKFHEVLQKDNPSFWEINACFFSYLNSVYYYREFIENYKTPKLKKFFKNLNVNTSGYRFVCELRNRVIHQSRRISDFSQKYHEAFLNLDDLITSQNNFISTSQSKFEKENIKRKKDQIKEQIEYAQCFLTILQSLAEKTTVKDYEDKRLLPVFRIFDSANEEIRQINSKLFTYIYTESLQKSIEWFITMTFYENQTYKYTFIVNDEIQDCYEPTFMLDELCRSILRSLGKDHSIWKETYKLLNDCHYDYFFDDQCTLDEFEKRYDLSNKLLMI